ncbi:hypothetical protein ASD50_07565 [Mesorhizobium sp. Root552]|jgi:hypothetical protein|uniref:hypothetical protein n=1 Tax=Mesorhizobium sp. Root552 TaxID=1736555 RepID=UPI0006FF9864|nr:hypothetical protein [Mesorhizobium sp. Root552]KQZ19335.1 hypothetical protein ASD50_07565 [Mesorhizobium sp. Root552]
MAENGELFPDAGKIVIPIEDSADPEPEWEMDWIRGQEVIIQEQRAVAVYRNGKNGIVIREERAWDEEEDKVIVLSTPEAANALIDAIKRELGGR